MDTMYQDLTGFIAITAPTCSTLDFESTAEAMVILKELPPDAQGIAYVLTPNESKSPEITSPAGLQDFIYSCAERDVEVDGGLESLANPAGDYELTLWVHFDYENYTREETGHWPAAEEGDFVIEAGRKDGVWRIRLRPRVPGTEKRDDIFAKPVIEMRDQPGGGDPLALLRALLTGGTFEQLATREDAP